MSKFNDIPNFGPLAGVRVVIQGGSIAGPLVGNLCGDYGADVIWLESTKACDISRNANGFAVQQNHKNQRSIALDVPGAGRQVFLDLLKTTDILVEANKGGQYERWGFTDEVLWEVNHKLVIVHISGFGQYGDPAYYTRASYDPIAQCFSGSVYANTPKGQQPHIHMPMTADHITGLMALSAAMIAYTNVLKTGKGESVDVTQYETLLRLMDQNMQLEWNLPEGDPWIVNPGDFTNGVAGYGFFECSDGVNVMMQAFGAAAMPKMFKLLGLEYGSEEWPAKAMYRSFEPQFDKYNAAIAEWCLAHTHEEVEDALNQIGVANMHVMNPREMLDHPQYVARESIIKIPFHKGGDIYACGIVPKFKNNPGQVWRMAPSWGGDTKDVLSDIGYTDEQIAQLYEEKAVSTSDFISL